MSAPFLNLSVGNAATGPLLSLSPQEVYSIAVQAAAEQGNFNLWWKAAIGFCVACCVAEWLGHFGVFEWASKHRWAYYLAFRKPPKDDKGNEDDKEKDAPPEAGKVD